MNRVGEPERERATQALRRHYVEGRLDHEELSDRLELVMRARNRLEIAYALRRLPWLDDLGARVRNGVVVAVALATWLMLTFAIFVAFLAWVFANGVSLNGLIAFPAVWLTVTFLLYRRALANGQRFRR